MKMLPTFWTLALHPLCPGLGDICSKLFTRLANSSTHLLRDCCSITAKNNGGWNNPTNALLPCPALPPCTGTKHESKMKIENNSKNNSLANDLRWFRWFQCSMRFFSSLFFLFFFLLFSVCCVSNVGKRRSRKTGIEAKEKRKPFARNKTYFLPVVL